MIGFCQLRKAIRSFRVDRIEKLILTENNFNQPENFAARDFFLKNLLPEDKEGIVSLMISGEKGTLNDVCQHWFLGNYLHKRTSNQIEFLLEKEMMYTYVPHLLLPYGTAIQIIEPISFKKRFVEVLSKLVKFHQT